MWSRRLETVAWQRFWEVGGSIYLWALGVRGQLQTGRAGGRLQRWTTSATPGGPLKRNPDLGGCCLGSPGSRGGNHRRPGHRAVEATRSALAPVEGSSSHQSRPSSEIFPPLSPPARHVGETPNYSVYSYFVL